MRGKKNEMKDIGENETKEIWDERSRLKLRQNKINEMNETDENETKDICDVEKSWKWDKIK